jgi:transcriptional antiterminator NusG
MITNRQHQRITGHREGGAAWVGNLKAQCGVHLVGGLSDQQGGGLIPARRRPTQGQGMTNTYAINTTKNREFEVERALKDLGLHPWVPKALASRYVKEKREVVWWERAYVPKLMFCVIPAIYWRDVVELKHVIGKPVRLSRLDIDGMPAGKTPSGQPRAARPGLKDFRQAVEAEYADVQRRRANSEYQCQYAPGQALELLDGVFEGLDATFRGVVRKAHDEFARLRVDVEFMGRTTSMTVDPDKVKARG